MANKRVEIEFGMTYGKLTVIGDSYISTQGHINYLCECSCGNIISTTGSRLKNGTVQSCGCLKKEQTRQMGKNRKGKSHLEKGEAGKNHLYNQYKNAAKKRNIEFLLTKEELIQVSSKNCYYCGIPPSQIMNKKYEIGSYIYNGIDRVNNSIGYTKDNCVPCCKQCNRSKSDLSLEEFYTWIKRVYNSAY